MVLEIEGKKERKKKNRRTDRDRYARQAIHDDDDDRDMGNVRQALSHDLDYRKKM